MCEPTPLPVDKDPDETREWVDSLLDVLHRWGPERVRYLLAELAGNAHAAGVELPVTAFTPAVNSIPPHLEPDYPGDEALEDELESALRWNAIATVVRANRKHKGLGGHLATYASVCTAFEVGFNHFFHAPSAEHAGDQVFFQGHASPGIYARAFLEGRLEASQLDLFRQELTEGGLSSYPHPWLMPEFWNFPTVSMGLGALQAIYQARFNRYLLHRGLSDTETCRVWNFLGDGEMDEPESVGALSVAAREGLDNLVFVVNCNLQRLDGPVRGNGSVVRELEGIFRGAGWNVLKVLWAREWDELFERDEEGHLARRLSSIRDGDLQRIWSLPGAERRKALFDTPELQALTAHLTDEEVERLRRGGHDRRKVYAAYKEAVDGDHPGVPTAILIHTVKGWGMGDAGESKNVAHQSKTLDGEDREAFRARFDVPVPEAQVEEFPYVDLEGSQARDYLRARRLDLGGHFPQRLERAAPLENPPTLDDLEEFLGDSGGREVSTTMAFVRMLGKLMRHPSVGELLVPIIPDEARTFGMDALFRPFGIYSPHGQRYEPVDKDAFLYYREAKEGQILEEGITEAGATSSFIAAGTAWAMHGVNTIPMYVFYSMFGFQRVMDLIWAAGDARAKGFLLGATAGRTTLNGEGLQHEDGHSHLLASCVPTVRAYDPAYGYETAVIVQDGIRRMYADGEPGFYYITLYNENYEQPAMPEGAAEGIVAGMYRLTPAPKDASGSRPQLFGSGPILNEVLRAREILATFGVEADVWSVTSYSQLRLDALAQERQRRLFPEREPEPSYLERCLEGLAGPFVAASDYVQHVPAQIAPWVPGHLHVLGTDGFGRSDTRAALRRHFEIDAEHVAVTTLSALARQGELDSQVVVEAFERFEIDREALDPVTR
ncbi:MAG: pyruvate dehydrogenase (acetyl-transferring), homodimeric type [Planctomycetota bacterium]